MSWNVNGRQRSDLPPVETPTTKQNAFVLDAQILGALLT